MRQLTLRAHLSSEQLKTRMLEQKQVRLHNYWQILNAVANSPGKKAQEIAEVLGTSANVVKRIVQTYNTKGADFDKTLQWGGRRQALALMSPGQEAALMKQLHTKALRGAILTFRDIKETVEKKLARQVSDDYIWSLFKRHGWSKKAPRPKHPAENIEAQQQFKKNFRGYWHPASEQ